MAKNEKIFFTKEGKFAEVVGITAGTTIATVGPDGAKWFSCFIATGITGGMSIYLREPGSVGVNVFNITDPLPYVNYLGNTSVLPVDSKGNRYMNIPPNTEILVAATAAVTARIYYENY